MTRCFADCFSAVIYECILTICRIHPEPSLLEKAAKCVSKFLSASSMMLRYIGEITPALCIQANAVMFLVRNDTFIALFQG